MVSRLCPPGAFSLTEALWLRLLGLIYLIAFASLWPQVTGLIGVRGVAPAAQLLTAMRAQYGARAFYYVPSLYWLQMSDAALVLLCLFGCLTSILLMLRIFSRTAAALCFVLYLSLSTVGQPFTSFQWDALLLECGFLAIFAGAPCLVWAYRLLLFRLMFESGWVKIASHDPNWRSYHALRFHFVTQPLPNPVAYYAHHAPPALLDALTFLAVAIEFVAPLLLFCPRRARWAGTGMLILLQLGILVTGNYAFFNLLSLALCLWGLDDFILAPMTRFLQWRYPRWPVNGRVPFWRAAGNLIIGLLVMLGLLQLLEAAAPIAGSTISPLRWVQPFEIVNSYGLFAVMTTTRPELIIEGSNNQTDWREYQFPYKPGNTHRGLPWVAPYQPRLDWQMWFAALGEYQSNTWVGGLLYRILTGEQSVYRLLDRPPFQSPPRYLRVLLYDYTFTTSAERARTGAVWHRELRGTWFGPVSLNGR